jgi:hypothetical protein
MTQTSTRDRIADLLRETGGAHHRAFAATNGDDPAWPRWYAEYLLAPLGDLLGRALTADALAAELRSLDVAHRTLAGAPSWPAFYADRLLMRYASGAASPSGAEAGEQV